MSGPEPGDVVLERAVADALTVILLGYPQADFPLLFASAAERETQRLRLLTVARRHGMPVRTIARGDEGRMVVLAPKPAGHGPVPAYLTRYQGRG